MDKDNKKPKEAPPETLEESSSDKTSPINVAPGAEIKPQPNSDTGADDMEQQLSSEAPIQSSAQEPAEKSSLLQRLKDASNLYLVIFLLVVAAAVAATVLALNSQKNSNSAKKISSLTSSQLAQLSGNTTIVGDSKQTLDIQSNTVLEGQLLVRQDLNVAGSIKVGGGISLSSITVGGRGNFGQLQSSGPLSVTGNGTFSGALSVQKNLNIGGSGSFGGSLSAASLSISSLQLNGDLRINRHITLGGSPPGKTNGSALGSGGTASVNGSDTAGTVTINTGGSPAAGCFVTVNFSHNFGSTPHVVISPSNSASAGLSYYATRTSSNFKVCSTNTPTASKTYLFDYIVID